MAGDQGRPRRPITTRHRRLRRDWKARAAERVGDARSGVHTNGVHSSDRCTSSPNDVSPCGAGPPHDGVRRACWYPHTTYRRRR